MINKIFEAALSISEPPHFTVFHIDLNKAIRALDRKHFIDRISPLNGSGVCQNAL